MTPTDALHCQVGQTEWAEPCSSKLRGKETVLQISGFLSIGEYKK